VRRSTSTSKLGGASRVQVVLEGDDCKPHERAYRFLQFEMLQAIANDPALTQCGVSYFDTLNIRHNGTCWVAVAEATAGG
jgi:hypothetical protein